LASVEVLGIGAGERLPGIIEVRRGIVPVLDQDNSRWRIISIF
jgi:predicted nicotinamide N-methyase